MITYYTEKDGQIMATADWLFDPNALTTERKIIYGPINSKGDVTLEPGQSAKLYFEDEVPIVKDIVELPTTEERVSAMEDVLLEILGGLSNV